MDGGVSTAKSCGGVLLLCVQKTVIFCAQNNLINFFVALSFNKNVHIPHILLLYHTQRNTQQYLVENTVIESSIQTEQHSRAFPPS